MSQEKIPILLARDERSISISHINFTHKDIQRTPIEDSSLQFSINGAMVFLHGSIFLQSNQSLQSCLLLTLPAFISPTQEHWFLAMMLSANDQEPPGTVCLSVCDVGRVILEGPTADSRLASGNRIILDGVHWKLPTQLIRPATWMAKSQPVQLGNDISGQSRNSRNERKIAVANTFTQEKMCYFEGRLYTTRSSSSSGACWSPGQVIARLPIGVLPAVNQKHSFLVPAGACPSWIQIREEPAGNNGGRRSDCCIM